MNPLGSPGIAFRLGPVPWEYYPDSRGRGSHPCPFEEQEKRILPPDTPGVSPARFHCQTKNLSTPAALETGSLVSPI